IADWYALAVDTDVRGLVIHRPRDADLRIEYDGVVRGCLNSYLWCGGIQGHRQARCPRIPGTVCRLGMNGIGPFAQRQRTGKRRVGDDRCRAIAGHAGNPRARVADRPGDGDDRSSARLNTSRVANADAWRGLIEMDMYVKAAAVAGAIRGRAADHMIGAFSR